MAVGPKLTPRRFPRFATDVICRYREAGSFNWLQGEILNLSKGGFCLKSKNPPERETIIEIEMDLLTEKGEWQRRRLRAQTVWKRGMRAGFRFLTNK